MNATITTASRILEEGGLPPGATGVRWSGGFTECAAHVEFNAKNVDDLDAEGEVLFGEVTCDQDHQ